MSAHTPGPWVVTRDYSIVTDATPATLLAKTASANYAANAKLIAAAPDLLQALKDIAFKQYNALQQEAIARAVIEKAGL